MEARTITRPFDLALIVGRMQSFHIGHEHLVNTALSVADRVLILLGSSQEYGTIKNPYSVITRQNMIKSVFPGDEVMVSALSDIDGSTINNEWGQHVLNSVKQITRKSPDVYIYGFEPKNQNWFKASEPLINSTKHMTEIIVAREKYPISATFMRQFLWDDDYESWAKFTNPKLHKYYDKFRAELMQAPGLADAVRLAKPRRPWTAGPTAHPMDVKV